MSGPSVAVGRLRRGIEPPGSDAPGSPAALPLADTVVAPPDASMRAPEFTIACAALVAGVLLGLAR